MLNHQIQGEGPKVLLIHGLFGDKANLNGLAKTLVQDYQVIQVDLRNHGESFWSNQMNYHLMAADVAQLLSHLKIKQLHVVGHSMGGKTAMALALTQPQLVQSLTVVDISPVRYEHKHTKVFDALCSLPIKQLDSRNQAIAHMQQQQIDIGTTQFLLKNLKKEQDGYRWRMNLDVIEQQYQQIADWPFSDETYSGPTLFIKGELSEYMLPQHQQQVVNHFPNAKAKVINGTGHWLHAEKPKIFHKLVGDFLTNCY